MSPHPAARQGFRSGPALGYSYEEAKALGLDSAKHGPQHYHRLKESMDALYGFQPVVALMDRLKEPVQVFKLNRQPFPGYRLHAVAYPRKV